MMTLLARMAVMAGARRTLAALALLALSCAPAIATDILVLTITTAITGQAGTTYQFRNIPPHAIVQCAFTYGSGGTSADVYVQTTIDGGTTWIDIVECGFTTASAKKVANLNAQTAVTTLYTPTDGSLTANTAKDGIVGPMIRTKTTTVGTYGGSTKLIVSVYPAMVQ